MKTKRRELQTFLMGLQECGKFGDIKFAYAIVKNRKAIRDEMAKVNDMVQQDPKFTEYEDKRMELVRTLADKDENGQIIVQGNQAQMKEHQKEFDEQIAALMQEYKEALDHRTEQVNSANEFMDGECELDFYKIPVAELPKDLSADVLERIMFMVDDAK